MTVLCSNSLLAHFHYIAAGNTPLTLDWYSKSAMDMVGNNRVVIDLMRKLENYTRSFSESSTTRGFFRLTSNIGQDARIYQKGCDRYSEEEETSLDFSLSSLVLSRSIGAFAELKDLVGDRCNGSSIGQFEPVLA